MNVVMTGAGRFVELQATAEKMRVRRRQLAPCSALGRKGVQELIALQKQALEAAG